jgi:Domain of unknown function (DUF4868)
MTLPELTTEITYFTTTGDVLTLTLYIVYEDTDGADRLSIADIDMQTAQELKEMFLDQLRSEVLTNPDLSFMDISAADDRKNAIYQYDLPQRPAELNVLNTVATHDEQPEFVPTTENFEKISAFIITIGTEQRKLILYKNRHRLNLIKGGNAFAVWVGNNRLERFRRDLIKLSPSIDFLQIGQALIILNLKTLESSFGFQEAIRHKATQNIALIQAAQLLDDVAPLTAMAEDLRQAKRIMKIRSTSPVLQLPVAEVLHFVTHHPPIMRKFRLSADGTRLKLDTNVSKQLFLDLLNDDLLTSELTKRYYMGRAKDAMEIEAVPASQ